MVTVWSMATCRSMACGMDGLQLRQHGADAVHGVDDVGARLAEDDHQHGRLAVGVAGIAQVFHRIHRVADIGDAHGGAVVIGDHQRLVVDGLEDLVVGAHFPDAIAVGEMPFGRVGVGRGRARCAPAPGRCRTCSDASGFSSMRTPGSALPPTITWPTPLTCDSFCAMMVEAASYIWPLSRMWRGEREHEDGRIGRIHLAVGGIVRKVGGQIAAGGVDGRLHVARGGVDVAVQIELQGDAGRSERAGRGHLGDRGDAPNWRSSGVATEDAMVSGLAPGKPALTEIVGKSTCGSGDTGRNRKATAPASAMATVSSVVAPAAG